MNNLDILGLIATCFSTSSFIPQIWRTWKTHDVSGISLPTYIILTTALSLWLLYGILKGDVPLIVANTVMIVLSSIIAAMKIVFGKR
jgi:MtN3 and saliva related transmembrane protein